jgi:hypothetical protein
LEDYEMKRLLLCLLIFAFLCAAPTAYAADGSMTMTQASLSFDQKILVIKVACLAATADGAVPATVISNSDVGQGLPSDYYRMGFYLYEVWTVAGTVTAPDAADVALKDAIAAEIYSEADVIASSGTTEGTVDKYRSVTSPLTVYATNHETGDATFDIYFKLVR